MSRLDDLDLITTTDPGDFLGVMERFEGQLIEARELSDSIEGLPSPGEVESIAVLGMGGSGISGDVLEVAIRDGSEVFVKTVKGYELPGWVDTSTLVFAASYSGDTEETLETFDEAMKRGSKIIVVSSGGKLTSLAEEAGLPIVRIPGGLQPRAAMGYLTVPMLVAWMKIQGTASSIGDALSETIELVRERARSFGRSSPTSSNPAKQLAERLVGTIPIVYGADGLSSVAAYRWKCQLNECSKVPSWSNSLPELNHNEIVGWEGLKEKTSASLSLVTLRHGGEHPRVSKRFEITIPMIEPSFGYVYSHATEATSALARVVDLSYFGDFVATYLAIATGVDPSPVEPIKLLKSRLTEG